MTAGIAENSKNQQETDTPANFENGFPVSDTH